MKIRSLIAGIFFLIPALLYSQADTGLNRTDPSGKKQGHWIKRYPDNTIMYEGSFKDNIPEGEFRRYTENGILKSVIIYSNNGRVADATIYHSNGYIAAKGKYTDRRKEGLWQFFSEYTEGYIVSEENYAGNRRHGKSVKLYPDGNVAEKMNFVNDTTQGEWIKYFPDGRTSLKSSFLNGKINGKFEAWFDNGQLQFSGEYINDKRNGTWLIYDRNGTLKYKLDYLNGVTNDRQMDIDSSDYLDSLENNKGRIPDPEKTGNIW
ncbi:MAG: toxin-antitoxin system YwqK family antitoxin [Bacteroidia bacterium]|nr:toxin-antitoxin system YwqK family antitoxin [Bacteroidia bacterium]